MAVERLPGAHCALVFLLLLPDRFEFGVGGQASPGAGLGDPLDDEEVAGLGGFRREQMEAALVFGVVAAAMFVLLEVAPFALVAAAEQVQDRGVRMILGPDAVTPDGVVGHEDADARFDREGSVIGLHCLSVPLGLRQPICSADKEYIHYLS